VRSERRSASRPTLLGQRRTTDRARGPRFDQHGPPRPWRTSAVTTDPQPGWRVCTGKWAARRQRRSNRFGRARRGSADRSRSGRNRLAHREGAKPGEIALLRGVEKRWRTVETTLLIGGLGLCEQIELPTNRRGTHADFTTCGVVHRSQMGHPARATARLFLVAKIRRLRICL
jgi:hypothetical protein